MASPAIFWDRDQTLIADPGYINDPGQVELLPGAAAAVRRLGEVGFQNIVTTNQSGIARGLLTEQQLAEIHDWLKELMAEQGAVIDAIYYCPYLDGVEAVIPKYRRESDLRKPKPGMLIKAAGERDIDLAASWSIGDSIRDAQAGRAAGCRTIVVCLDASQSADLRRQSEVDFVVGSLNEAVETVLKYARTLERSRPGPGVESAAAPGGDTAVVLQEILAFLKMVDRRGQAEDFSLARLAGAVAQILALAALIWAVFAALRNESLGVQIVRLLFALLLQLIALTLFVLSPRKP